MLPTSHLLSNPSVRSYLLQALVENHSVFLFVPAFFRCLIWYFGLYCQTPSSCRNELLSQVGEQSGRAISYRICPASLDPGSVGMEISMVQTRILALKL